MALKTFDKLEISKVLAPQKNFYTSGKPAHYPQLAILNHQDIPPTAKTVFQIYAQLTALTLGLYVYLYF